MPIPDFNNKGDFPDGVHQVSMDEVAARFGVLTAQRQIITATLLEIHQLAKATGKLDRFILAD